jgi:two-component system, chemotaxis family, CheB/CheR fusion protein
MATKTPGTEQQFEGLLDYIREHRGFDFSGYKRPSLHRRIEKRMQDAGAATYADYLEKLTGDDEEFAQLFDTILINVTGFFRDPPAWQFLREEIVPKIVATKGSGEQIRIWSAGCATGEEAYSLAMVFADATGEGAFAERVKIYATDIDEGALTEARHGIFDADSVKDVPDEFRKRYFESLDSRFIFSSDLRRSVIFGRNDLLVDPPISRVDLISTRNTLMYFNPDVQRRILLNFHFALAPTGYLFLGRSETLLTRSSLFVPVDLKKRIFSKGIRDDIQEQLREMVEGERAPGVPIPEAERIRQASFESGPVAQLVVDPAGNLAAANVQARSLFNVNQRDLGRPLQDLEISYRPVELRSLIEQAYAAHHPVSVRDVEWARGADSRSYDLQVGPLHAFDGSLVGMSVTFVETTRYRKLQEANEQVKERLETAYEELQSTAEELETTNEELQSTNEELETTNEELQSTNEELETMNEELQSTNEELETMNDELRLRTEDLHQVNAFLESILGGLHAGVVVTDNEFHVQAWNEHSRELWGLQSSEVHGQHLMNLDIGLPVDDVMPLLRRATTDGSPDGEVVVDAVNRRGRRIQARVRVSPMNGPDGVVRGAILVVEEVDSKQDE